MALSLTAKWRSRRHELAFAATANWQASTYANARGCRPRAVQRLAELGGGMVVVRDRGIRAELPLPVAGLLSDAPLEQVLEQTAAVSAAALDLGTSLEAPFHAVGFLSLSVIPELKITDRGLIDVGRFEIVPLVVGS